MGNLNVFLRSGYQEYFSLLIGFEPESNIASTSLTNSLFTINYTDGSRVEFGVAAGSSTGIDPSGHLTLTTSLLGQTSIFSPGNQIVATIGVWGSSWNGPLFGPSFLPTILGFSNNILPFTGEDVTGAQTLIAYGGGPDRIVGGSANDTLIFTDTTVLMSGGAHNFVTGNDTFVFPSGTNVPIDGSTYPEINGVVAGFGDVLQPGEVNTIDAQHNVDFSSSDIRNINRIVFDGASELIFAGGNFSFYNTDRISAAAEIVGDATSNSLSVYMSPSDISPGHSSANGIGVLDLSQLVFQNWTPGSDTVTIHGFLGLSQTIKGPNAATIISGSNSTGNGDTITGGSADDIITGLGDGGSYYYADVIDGGGGIDTAVYRSPSYQYTITTSRDSGGVMHTTVTHVLGTGADGQDILTNVERLQFTDQTISTAEAFFDFYKAVSKFGSDKTAGVSAAQLAADATAVLNAARAGNDVNFASGPANAARQHAHDSMAAAADVLSATIAAGGTPAQMVTDMTYLLKFSLAEQVGAAADLVAEDKYVGLLDESLTLHEALRHGAGLAELGVLGDAMLTRMLGPIGNPERDEFEAFSVQQAELLAPAITLGGLAGRVALDQLSLRMTAELISIVSGSSPEKFALITNALDVLKTDSGPMRQLAAEATLFNTPDETSQERISSHNLIVDLDSLRFTMGDAHLSGIDFYTREDLKADAAAIFDALPADQKAIALTTIPGIRSALYIGSEVMARTLSVDEGAEKLGNDTRDEIFREAANALYGPFAAVGRALSSMLGDVHLTTFDGLHYDFQAAGEFVFTRSERAGDSFQIQARLEPWFNSAAVTVTTQLAATIGSDRVTVDATRADPIWINGSPAGLSDNSPALQLAAGQVIRVSDSRFVVSWDTGQNLTITDRGTYLDSALSVFFSSNGYTPGSVSGLLGPNMGHSNAFELPDGTVLAQPLSSTQLYSTFANAWRVNQSGSLFDYAPGQDTSTFTKANFPLGSISLANLPQNLVAEARLAVAAGGVVDPVAAADATLDFLATGDPNFIKSGRAFSNELLIVTPAVINQSGPLPVLAGIHADAAKVLESISGTTTVAFTVYLTASQSTPTLVNYAVIAPGTQYFEAASFGGTLPTGQVVIAANQTSAQLVIQLPAGATGSQPSEILDIQITTPNGEAIFAATAQTEVTNPRPVIISDGGGDTAGLSVLEHYPIVTTVQARDLLPGAVLTYSIVGGADAGSFQINAATGGLSFVSAPDFATPADADHNNNYIVQVRAFDGTLADDQLLSVQVTQLATVPVVVTDRIDPGTIDIGFHPGAGVVAAVGDFNGDGTSDQLFRDQTTGLVDEWQQQNGHWQASFDLGATHGSLDWTIAGAGDFNGDGTSDVLWFNVTTGQVDEWQMQNGDWAKSIDFGATHGSLDWKIAGIGDFNGDGASDVLWLNNKTGQVDEWQMQNSLWSKSVDLGATHGSSDWQVAGIGDFNGDGASDVLWFNSATGQVDEWQMKDGQWAKSFDHGATHQSLDWKIAGTGDADRDGTSDVLWLNDKTGQMDLWKIENGFWVGSFGAGSKPLSSQVVGIGDINNDQTDDALFHDSQTGHITAGLNMNVTDPHFYDLFG